VSQNIQVAALQQFLTTSTAAMNSTTVAFTNVTNAFLNYPIGTPTGYTVQTPFLPAPQPVTTPPPLGFNRYVNASDLLEEFIAFLGAEGVRKGEVMGLPVELFIKWLVIRACEQDREEPGVVLNLPAPKLQPRCLGCGRWMARAATLLLHGPQCASWHFARG
jgi:hypothetical protein